VPPLNEDQRKHLDYVQDIVSRMSTDSFLIKGWAITVAAAVYGFAADHSSWRVAAVGLLPAIVFWGLDAYYLWHERLFRALYDAVRVADSTVEAYSMNIKPFKTKDCSWWGVGWSRTVWPIYALIVLAGVLLIVNGANHSAPSPQAPSKAALISSRTSSWTCSLRFSLGGQMSPTSSSSQRGTTCTWR
jgi:hypothetical protein